MSSSKDQKRPSEHSSTKAEKEPESFKLKSEAPMVGYGSKRFEVPQRFSSKFQSVASSAQIEAHKQHAERSQDLKRKASILSVQSTQLGKLHQKASIEFIQTRRDLLKSHSEEYTTLLEGYKAGRANKALTEQEFVDLTDSCYNKRAKLAAEELVLDRDRDRILQVLEAKERPDFEGAYTALFTQIFKHEEGPADWERRKNYYGKDERDKYRNETSWRRDVRKHYNAVDPDDAEQLWCPILQEYAAKRYRKTAHIVPHSLGYPLVGYIFGDPDKGREYLWELKNAIIMSSSLEEGFDKGFFVLLPLESKPGEPSRWQFYLLASDKAKKQVGETGVKWGQLHERELVWKNDKRPGHRYLYYHFVANMLRYQRYEKPGWEKYLSTLPNGTLWATPGAYLRKSMLKVLAQGIGDIYQVPSWVGFDTTFEGDDILSAEDEERMMKEVLVASEMPDIIGDLLEEEEKENDDEQDPLYD